jgi:hypothetical protein
MSIFGPPKAGDYPRQWKDMSFDFKLMFVFHGCMMILFIIGGALSVRQELDFTSALLVVLASLSIRNRRISGWHWHGVKSKDVLMASGIVALMSVFLYAATPQFSPLSSRFLPWYLAGFGIGAFNVMQQLRLVFPSNQAFLADCQEAYGHSRVAPPPPPLDAQWQRIIRATYHLLFFVIWLGFLAFFYYSGTSFRDGSQIPTANHPDAVTEHGKTVYITHEQKILCDKLELYTFVGIPSIILGGLIIHFLAGVKLYPNVPTLRELLVKRQSGS